MDVLTSSFHEYVSAEKGKTREQKKFRIGFRAETHDAQRLAQDKCERLHRIFSPMSFPFPSSCYRRRTNFPFAQARNFPLISLATAPDFHGYMPFKRSSSALQAPLCYMAGYVTACMPEQSTVNVFGQILEASAACEECAGSLLPAVPRCGGQLQLSCRLPL